MDLSNSQSLLYYKTQISKRERERERKRERERQRDRDRERARERWGAERDRKTFLHYDKDLSTSRL